MFDVFVDRDQLMLTAVLYFLEIVPGVSDGLRLFNVEASCVSAAVSLAACISEDGLKLQQNV